jgi:hypothetical protein
MSKTLRQFQCRDDLWTRVDALAKRRGISTDDVIQHALMQLFKTKKKEGEASAITPVPGTGGPAARPAPATRPAAPGPGTTLPRPPGPPSPARPPGPPLAATPPASASSSGLGVAAKSATMAPKLPRPATASASPAPAPIPAPAAVPGPPATSTPGIGSIPKPAPSLPRPQPTAAPAPTRLPPPAAKPAAQQVRPLYLMFENQWYEVDKEEFVIGRGQKFSDLPIKDANISRRHCSIVRRGADYFIKDLGSTNGVEFEGTRVDNHKIVEGSVYFLCDHELRFSFTPPSSLG